MLSHWFNPLDSSLVRKSANYCQAIHEDGKDFPLIAESELAIIGFNSDFSNSIRGYLYGFENHFSNTKITDLGNLKSLDVEFVLPAIQEVVQSNIIPICLGAPAHLIQKLRHRLGNENDIIFHLSNRLPEYHNDDKFEVLGFQRHLCAMNRIIELEEVSQSSMSLAKIRMEPQIQEAVLRDANIVHIDGSVVKLADNPASIESNTSGLTCEEACQSMKYVGASQNLQILNITNYEILDKPRQRASHITLSEMLWYFIEGFTNRLNDHPKKSHDIQKFEINTLDTDATLTFLKNELTGRWWFVANAENDKYIACAYQEYIEASKGEIPVRLLNYIS